MIGVRVCPKCEGEVEVIRLKDTKDKKKQYRIQCKRCGYTVAKGTKYPEETNEQGEERIKQYEEYIKRMLAPLSSAHIQQSYKAKVRDHAAKFSSRADPENEFED